MSNTFTILGIASAIGLGAMSPGPSFVMVARTAVAASRAEGLAAALGMGIGGVIFSAVALLGLQAVLAAVPGLYFLTKILGGAYLIYLGVRIWRGAGQTLRLAVAGNDANSNPGSFRRAFFAGLGTQLSNPKTAIVYASIFAALLPSDVPLTLALVLPALIFAIEGGWYALVALVLSSSSPRALYLRCKSGIDRTAGGVMMLLN